MTKNTWTLGAAVVAVVISLLAFGIAISQKGGEGSTHPNTYGSSVNGGNVTDYTAVNVTAGYWAGGVKVINSVGGIVTTALSTLSGGLTFDYTNSTSTKRTTQTLTAADISNYSTIIMTPNTDALTLTLPASSTLSALIPNAGDWTVQCWINATSTATATLTFAAGNGIDLEVASSSLIIYPGNSGCFRFIRKPATATAFDIIAQFTAFVDGD